MTARLRILIVLVSCLLWTGCQHAPSFNLLGSYFPAWMPCLASGILLTVLLRFLAIRFRVDGLLWPTVVTYPSAAAFFTFTMWLLLFS
jgi:hypothetical protein